MIKPERLFDCLSYQLEKFPKPDMLAAKEKGEWRKYSTSGNFGNSERPCLRSFRHRSVGKRLYS